MKTSPSSEGRRAGRTRSWHRRAPKVAALLVYMAGAVNLVSMIYPHLVNGALLSQALPGLLTPRQAAAATAAATAAVGVGLLLLAGALRRRNRWAWIATLVLLALSVASHLLHRYGFAAAIFQATLLGWLLGRGSSFRAHRPADERRHLVRGLLLLVAVTLGYGLVVLAVNDYGIFTSPGLGAALQSVARMAIALPASPPLPDGPVGDALPASLAALFLTGCVVTVARALAPGRAPGAHGATPEELRVSDDSLAYFATRDDRITIRTGAALVSYGAAGGVALAGGDPVGPREAWPEAVAAFLDEVDHTGRVPAVIGCGEEASDVYRDAGMIRVYLGDEAVLDLETFDIDAPSRKRAREGWHRGLREGLTSQTLRACDVTPEEAEEFRRISDRWLGNGIERGFSMSLGRLFDPRDRGTVFVVARDADGRVRGFLHLVPWKCDGLSLDVMRRDPRASTALSDFVIVEAARSLRELGVRRLSLNFAFMRGLIVASGRAGAPWYARVEGWVLRRLSGTFQIESLERFNRKFDPQWYPRYGCVEALGDVPRAGLAMGGVEGQFDLRWWYRLWRRPALEAPALTHASAVHPPVVLTGVRAGADETQATALDRLDVAVGTIRSASEGVAPGGRSPVPVSIEAVVTGRRLLGGVAFLVLSAGATHLQAVVERSVLGEAGFAEATHLPLGSTVRASGAAGRSRRGEPSLLVEQLAVPMPVP